MGWQFREAVAQAYFKGIKPFFAFLLLPSGSVFLPSGLSGPFRFLLVLPRPIKQRWKPDSGIVKNPLCPFEKWRSPTDFLRHFSSGFCLIHPQLFQKTLVGRYLNTSGLKKNVTTQPNIPTLPEKPSSPDSREKLCFCRVDVPNILGYECGCFG